VNYIYNRAGITVLSIKIQINQKQSKDPFCRVAHTFPAQSRTYDLNFYKSSIMSDKRIAEEGRFAGLALAEEELVARVAWCYYHDGLTQNDIGERLGLPREDLPPAGERPPVRGDPRADQLPL
jgi:hypothetical protein